MTEVLSKRAQARAASERQRAYDLEHQCLMCMELADDRMTASVTWLDWKTTDNAELCLGCIALMRRKGIVVRL